MSFPSEQDRFLREQEHHGNLDFKEDPGSEIPIVTSTPRGIGFWTPFCIVGGILAAALIGVLHYVFDSHLNNRSVSGFWTQAKSSQIEILLANVFKILFCFSAGVSLVQVVCYSLEWRPYSEPSPVMAHNAASTTAALVFASLSRPSRTYTLPTSGGS
jgi:hypothetical protein